jgi:hypothetical protein
MQNQWLQIVSRPKRTPQLSHNGTTGPSSRMPATWISVRYITSIPCRRCSALDGAGALSVPPRPSPLAPRLHDEHTGRRRCVPARRKLASWQVDTHITHPIHPLRREEHNARTSQVDIYRRIRIESGGGFHSAAARAGRFGPRQRMSVVAHAMPARCERARSGDRRRGSKK